MMEEITKYNNKAQSEMGTRKHGEIDYKKTALQYTQHTASHIEVHNPNKKVSCFSFGSRVHINSPGDD